MNTALLASRKSLHDLYGRNGYDSYSREHENKNSGSSKFNLKELDATVTTSNSSVLNIDLSREIEATLIEDAEYSDGNIKADMPLASDLSNDANRSNGIYGTLIAFRAMRGNLQHYKAA